MATYKDILRDRRRAMRLELKQIESALHPHPVINGVEIVHRHQGQNIYFTAWVGESQVNNRELVYSRGYVLMGGKNQNFYQCHEEDFNYLVGP